MKKFIYYLLIFICACALALSSYNIIVYFAENKKAQDVYESLRADLTQQEDDNEQCPIEIDFDMLRSKNEDIIAWIYCEGTPINYPVMKSKDNTDYLRCLPDGTYNRSGSLFLDYLNSADFSDFASIIYGHNMKTDTMFGTLPKYKNQDYYNLHPVMYLLTPNKHYIMDIVSGFEEDAHSDIYSKEGEEFVDKIGKLSDFKAKASFDYNDKFVILSTCEYTNYNSRYLVVAKMTEI